MALTATLAVASSGCAVRTDFIPVTGERVRVVDEMRMVSVSQQVKVGETRDSRGNVSEHFAQKEERVPMRFVNGVQGRSDVDDESFYRIVNDTEAVATYDAYHAKGKRTSALGIGIDAVSGVLVAGGIGLLMSSAVDGDPAPCRDCDGGFNRPLNNLGYVSIVGIIVGGLGLIAGTTLWTSGAAQARETDARLYPIDATARRMKEGASRYNLGLKEVAR